MNTKQWFVYIVQCVDNTLYTGCTLNIERRIKEHNEGKGAKYTRGRGPVLLQYQEEFVGRSQAQKRECAIKRLSRIEK